jgi:predicted O-methyltransferase YrrM
MPPIELGPWRLPALRAIRTASSTPEPSDVRFVGHKIIVEGTEVTAYAKLPRQMYRIIANTSAVLLKRPAEIRHIPRWIASFLMRRSPLDLCLPWLPYTAIELLGRKISGKSNVFEYGSGGSTVWLAQRTASVVSVEHDEAWRSRVQSKIDTLGIANCRLMLVRSTEVNRAEIEATPWRQYLSDASDGLFRDYVATIDEFPDDHFDLVVIDGRCRAACIGHSVPKLRRGGLLLLDDSERDAYKGAIDALEGWEKIEIQGFRHQEPIVHHTTLWIKP